mmetsp:Transcript_87059/g.164109  ORF Transcript_87059/g.164109 Transcript_87059/m.164109 type:complete len:168 (+) Transcript_87059:57-560(+)
MGCCTSRDDQEYRGPPVFFPALPTGGDSVGSSVSVTAPPVMLRSNRTEEGSPSPRLRLQRSLGHTSLPPRDGEERPPNGPRAHFTQNAEEDPRRLGVIRFESGSSAFSTSEDGSSAWSTPYPSPRINTNQSSVSSLSRVEVPKLKNMPVYTEKPNRRQTSSQASQDG